MNGVRRFLGGGGITESPGPPGPLALDLTVEPPSGAGPSGLGSASTASAYSIPSSGNGGGLSPGATNALSGLGSAGLSGLGNTAALFLKKGKSQKKNGSESSSGESMGAEDLGPWVSRGNIGATTGTAVETKADIPAQGRERISSESGSEPRRSTETVNPNLRTNGFPSARQIQRPTLLAQPALPQSPTLRPPLQRTTRDDLLLSLLASEAVVESREFAILNLEEVEEYKKEETILASRLANLSKKLETDGRIRDAAVTLSSLSKSKSTSTTDTSDQLASANLRYDTTLKEYNRVSQLKTDVSRKLLEHRAGVLSESVRRAEEQQAQFKSGTGNARDSGYDTATSSPSSSAFNSFSFFAGHPSSATPFSPSSKTLSKDIGTKESESDAAMKDLSSQLKSAESQIQMIRLEKDQVETMLGMEVQGLEERVQVSEERLREAEHRVKEAEERIHVAERNLNAGRKEWEDERTSYEDQRGRMQQEFQEERGRMIEEMSRGGNGMQMMQSELEAKSQVITEMETKLGQTQALLTQTQSQLQTTQAQLEQLELNTSTSLQELIHTHNIPLLSTSSSSSGFLLSLSSSLGSSFTSSPTLLEAIGAHLEGLRARISGMEQTQAEYLEHEASFTRKEEIWSQREAEFSRIKEQHTLHDSEFSRTKDDFGRKEQEYARREGEYLTQLRLKDESLRQASEEHSQEVSRMKVEFARQEESWELLRRGLEDDVRKGMDQREELGIELDSVRREVLRMRTGGGTAVLQSPTSPINPGSTAFPFPLPVSPTPPTLTDDTNVYTSPEAQSILSLLRPLWAILPSPEARAAKFASSRRGVKGGSAGPGSPNLTPINGSVSPGGPGAKSISDLDVRSLKSLYDASSSGKSNSSSPTPGSVSNASSNVEPFTLSSFISRINSLLADDRLLIERLLRFAQAHDLLKKNAERAQKLAMDSNSALETYQRQVRVLEERNGDLGRRVGECQGELASLQDIIDRISSAKSDLEIRAAEQAETCHQLSEANNTLSARALLLAEEAAEAQAKARSNATPSPLGDSSIALERDRLKAELSKVQNELETLKKQLKDALEELEAMRSSGQAQNVMLMEELMVTQTENADLREQLRGLKGK